MFFLEQWRILLYPLGFLSSLAFGIRFLLQWFQSEKKGYSFSSKLFWKISLLGNVLLCLHSFIQIQFHVCLIQACNGVISWRNFNLLNKKKSHVPLKKVLIFLAATIVAVPVAFYFQNYLLDNHQTWFRIPKMQWKVDVDQNIPLGWHLLGFLGYLLFSSRFWLQWWMSEKLHTSYFPPSFWWMSLIGACFTIFYFFHIRDYVNLVGPLFGIFPYIRNLILTYRYQKA